MLQLSTRYCFSCWDTFGQVDRTRWVQFSSTESEYMLNYRPLAFASVAILAACGHEAPQNGENYLDSQVPSLNEVSGKKAQLLTNAPQVKQIAQLSLDSGNTITINSVALPDGTSGVEIHETGKPGAPTIDSVAALDEASPLEIFNALAAPEAEVPGLLRELFEQPQLGSQGWLRSEWADLKPDFNRFSCSNSWFNDKCFNYDSYNHSVIRYDQPGSYSHQKTGPITRYRSRVCSQSTVPFFYRIRRQPNAGDDYIDWSIFNVYPGEYYKYRWTSSSGVYRFRTEIIGLYGILADLENDICVRWDLLSDS